eukprot:719580-Amphidinium_carterae.3
MEGECTVWVPHQRRTAAEHVLSAWSCAVEDEIVEIQFLILAIWHQGRIGLNSTLLPLSSSSFSHSSFVSSEPDVPMARTVLFL